MILSLSRREREGPCHLKIWWHGIGAGGGVGVHTVLLASVQNKQRGEDTCQLGPSVSGETIRAPTVDPDWLQTLCQEVSYPEDQLAFEMETGQQDVRQDISLELINWFEKCTLENNDINLVRGIVVERKKLSRVGYY